MSDFIEKIAPLVQKYAPQYGIKVVSPIIAQAILESASGTSNKVFVKDEQGNIEWRHNYFGLKWRNNRCAISNDYFEEGTSEQKLDGTYYQKKDVFCKFKSMEDCVIGYFQWTNIPNYANLKGVTDPRTYLVNIKADKYATSINYVDNLMSVINNYSLTRFDNTFIEKNDCPINIFSMYGKYNMSGFVGREIKYIVIHYTAGTKSVAGASKNNAAYFNKISTNASADFIVDDQFITQYNGNIENQYTWHCGKGKYNTKGGSLYGICKNSNSIAIEMCSCNITGKCTDANDNNWYFTQPTVQNAIDLVKFLMKKYNIKPENVVRHYDVNGKPCPGVYGWNEDTGNNDKWLEFKNLISR